MSIGTSIFLMAVGAILRFAVTVHSNSFNIHTVGVILIIAGAVGLVLSILWLMVWRDRHGRTADTRYVDRP